MRTTTMEPNRNRLITALRSACELLELSPDLPAPSAADAVVFLLTTGLRLVADVLDFGPFRPYVGALALRGV